MTRGWDLDLTEVNWSIEWFELSIFAESWERFNEDGLVLERTQICVEPIRIWNQDSLCYSYWCDGHTMLDWVERYGSAIADAHSFLPR